MAESHSFPVLVARPVKASPRRERIKDLPDAHGPSYGGVWGLKSLSLERPVGLFGASGFNIFQPKWHGEL